MRRSTRARQAAAYGQGSSEGYGDNLDCGVRIRGDKGSTVNLHIVSMNIEGDGNGICNEANEQYIGHSCNTNGGDFLEIYDGTSADAPLLGRINGQPTDAVLARDSFTTTGRDMYVHFTTDSGNYGLTNSGATPPGFFAEWQIIKEGGECVNFEARPGMALVGHNNEQLVGMTVDQCTAACCARNWCKSFDYIQQSQTCNLADVDSNTQFGTTTQNRYDTLYQRPADSITQAPAGRAVDCPTKLTQISADVDSACCPAGGCSNGVPKVCSEECAALWLPFAKQCSDWLANAQANLVDITAHCEKEEFGRWKTKPTANHRTGRCSDSDFAEFGNEMSAACPGWYQVPYGGMPATCSSDCAEFFEEYYSECHPRFASEGTARQMQSFLAVCQGYTGGRGGQHRRQLETKAAPKVFSFETAPKAAFGVTYTTDPALV